MQSEPQLWTAEPTGRTRRHFSGRGQGLASRGRAHWVQGCGRWVGASACTPTPPAQGAWAHRAVLDRFPGFTQRLPLRGPSVHSDCFSHRLCWTLSSAEHSFQGFLAVLLSHSCVRGQPAVGAASITPWGKSLAGERAENGGGVASPVALEQPTARAGTKRPQTAQRGAGPGKGPALTASTPVLWEPPLPFILSWLTHLCAEGETRSHTVRSTCFAQARPLGGCGPSRPAGGLMQLRATAVGPGRGNLRLCSTHMTV